MCTIGEAKYSGTNNTTRRRRYRVTFFGLSSDAKPTTVFNDDELENGSAFVEMDTATVYFYDAENAEWREWVK